jgi:hypothetical protein
MARKHIWYFLKDEEGVPINEAQINIYLTGTTTEATIYDSYTTSAAIAQTDIISNPIGYFDFYIGDQFEESPNIGYTPDQYFDLVWTKTGNSGIIDGLQFFELLYQVDETDLTSTYKDKMVNNELAYRWDYHVDRNYPSEPHGIEEVDITDPADGTFNKVVSNEMLNRLYNFPITSGGLTVETSAGLFTTHYIYTSGATWAPSGDYFKVDFDPEWPLPGRTAKYPIIQVYDYPGGNIVRPVSIIDLQNDLIRLIVAVSGNYVATCVGETD